MHFNRKHSCLLFISSSFFFFFVSPDPVFHFKPALTFWLWFWFWFGLLFNKPRLFFKIHSSKCQPFSKQNNIWGAGRAPMP